MLKVLWLCLSFVLMHPTQATELTASYNKIYQKNESPLDQADINRIEGYEIVFINGVASEFFLKGFIPNFAWATTEYFSASLNELKRLNLNPKRVAPSSFSLSRARNDISQIFTDAKSTAKPLLFITHSLGGLLLLEHLVSFPEDQNKVAGMIFIQSPFFGSPIAEIVKSVPLEMANYLSVGVRQDFMAKNQREIDELFSRVPSITLGTVANNYRSVFAPTLNLMKYGCLTRARGRCVSPRLFKGPFSDSDGMVPLASSRISNVANVTLRAIDHGETVMNLPYESVKKSRMTNTLIKLLIEKR